MFILQYPELRQVSDQIDYEKKADPIAIGRKVKSLFKNESTIA